MTAMTIDLPIRCECGSVSGRAFGLLPRTVNRVICHCSDCQDFAHWLDQADRVLDAHGGSDICQVSPRTIRFESGADRLACIRLTSKGPYRWYASCCRSPIANTVPGLPFAGLVRPTVQPDEVGLTSIHGRIFGCDAIGDPATLQASDRIPLRLLGRVARKLLLRRLRGDHRHSPFHDHATGQALARPDLLSSDERAMLQTKRLAWSPKAL
jgi:hypothetical protein